MKYLDFVVAVFTLCSCIDHICLFLFVFSLFLFLLFLVILAVDHKSCIPTAVSLHWRMSASSQVAVMR